jgi:hypothetical protein
MVSLRTGQKWWASPVVLALLVPLVFSVTGDDDPQAKQRLEFMNEVLRRIEIAPAESGSKTAFTFADKPLLRYSDPTRDIGETANNVLLDAGVWRLGTEGRPTALVTIEVYQSPGKSRTVGLEFLSLSELRFSMKHKTENIRWNPASSALDLKELPDAPKPADSAAARLVQMRRLSRRFEAKERYRNASIECRLLTQPIDRYQSEAENIVDGAIFAYANGTNPELAVVLETDGKHWRYGVLRLSSAESSVTFDGQQVAAFEEQVDQGRRTDWPYHNATYKVAGGK